MTLARKLNNLKWSLLRRGCSKSVAEKFVLSLKRLALAELKPLCEVCRKRMEFSQWSVDHLQPLSRGGSNQPNNFGLVHKRCNMIKGDMTPDECRALMKFLEDPAMVQYGSRLVKRLIAAGWRYRG